MIYIILNFLSIFFFIYISRAFDHNKAIDTSNMSEVLLSLMVFTIQTILFTLILIFTDQWSMLFNRILLKACFFFEGLAFIMFSFGILGLGLKKRGSVFTFTQVAFVVLLAYIVFIKFETVDVTLDSGVIIGSNFLFSSKAVVYFPWAWGDLYTAIYRFALPAVSVLLLMIIREDNSTQLQKYQGFLFMEALFIMWFFLAFIKYVSKASMPFKLLNIYAYLFMYVFLYQAFLTTSVPSKRAIFAQFLKLSLCYVIPAVLLGALIARFQPHDMRGDLIFQVILTAGATIGILFSWRIMTLITTSARLYNNDYEAEFEKELAAVDYSGEMDQVTARMFQVFKNNVECSSMNVYIDGGHGSLIPAYSSNKLSFNYPIRSKMLEYLVSENCNIVIYNEIDDRHEYQPVLSELHMFFERAKCDAMFILAEGHNIVGIITLGRKTSGDHYKEYDKNVFTKLFSYFFVFGYYMRNISNKEVLSVVNREIKMSSQIITSIQENVDQIKNVKMDVGYKMVPAHNIGGEFIDLIRLTENRHLMVVGDLSGKGIAASMNMVILKSIIRTYLAETHDFKQLVVKINQFVRESMIKGTIFQGLFALLDFETDTMYYINCGIPALFMYTQVYNNVIEIQGSGHILGFVKDIAPYISVKTTKLNRGDIILACTDGLINSHSLRGEKYGKERVVQSIMNNATYPAQRMAQFTFEDLTKFMSKEMEDDVSLILFKYKTGIEFATEAEKAKEREEAEKAAAEAAAANGGFAGSDSVVEEAAPETPAEAVEASASEESVSAAQEPAHEMTEEERLAAFVAQMEAGEAMAKEKEAPSVEDDMFNTNLSADSNNSSDDSLPEGFNPADFGLPDDFQL